MSLIELIILIVVAGLAGAIGQALAGNSRGGCLVSIALGFVGAVIGVWLARSLGLPEIFVITVGGTTFPIVWSIIGAALFVAILGFFSRR
ncbi:MAG TPA: GlsB/YeaQ/YmgE family stress response membrane protein [Anaerolineae bacterium]|nr:GlsB/YeaQ/YmgE family stress response membrane protein [Anaerolineae bacterium]